MMGISKIKKWNSSWHNFKITTFPGIMCAGTKNSGQIDSAVLTFIGLTGSKAKHKYLEKEGFVPI